ncbi:polyphenol oxidase family protein [uncultured Campylobacter sp.]|uniref:polyphenol oxidase family protein n=1 Tax=uncultured Campylobacter sp. TaxID=218934 RepID=UPI00260755EA|nr:polyphenol oxidase family protein [uncultured Campylobacter sp.]
MSKNALYLLDNKDCSIFCVYGEDFMPYAAKIVDENLFKDFESGIKTCVFMKQTHSNNVLIYNENVKFYDCDGLVTDKKHIALCVLSADCLPLILWHKSGFIANLHSGRQGSFDNILKNAIFLLEKKGVKSSELNLFIAPSICFKNYEIAGDVLSYAKTNFNDFVYENKLDLKAIVKDEAEKLGITNIIDSGICTFDDERFFSYRRDKSQQRFVTVAYLKD